MNQIPKAAGNHQVAFAGVIGNCSRDAIRQELLACTVDLGRLVFSGAEASGSCW